MTVRSRNQIVHTLFDIGVISKAVDGVLEIIGGILLFFVNPAQIHGLLRALTQHELSEDPHDLIAGLIMRSVQHLSMGTEAFAAVFLLWHGAVKIGVVWALWQKKFWAYPIAIVAFGLFLIYQVYRYSLTHSVWLLVLSFLDLFVIILTWLEYRRLRSSHGFSQSH
ncbi:probable membrane protein YPO2961 [Sulfuriferula multivorans]|uniref:Probable membrane protein YPO2961 n=1 Tax=Sulfuriferula multivorans TaxID=1559896 RepID=A0A401JB97_9PROT|nr:DUF2127 domain-containing protein [Sulfuriferula multivorans]GBL44844.1 probable membrane protein YPO2961 [Sulfuriferula multivorans]